MIKDIFAKIKNLVSPNKKNAAKVRLTNGTIIEGTAVKIVTYGGGGGGGGGSKHQNLGGGAEPKWMSHQSNAATIRALGEKE
jgi:hypothetical protein